jgi:hypothetical protein
MNRRVLFQKLASAKECHNVNREASEADEAGSAALGQAGASANSKQAGAATAAAKAGAASANAQSELINQQASGSTDCPSMTAG